MATCGVCEGKADGLCDWHYLIKTIYKMKLDNLNVRRAEDVEEIEAMYGEVIEYNGRIIGQEDEKSWQNILFEVKEGARASFLS